MLIRAGRESDRQALDDLLDQYGMKGDTDPVEFLIAEEDETLLGAARLEWFGAEVYLRSMVVAPPCQGKGIGSELVKELIKAQDQVKVVARGYSAPFYSNLGFQPMNWSAIHPDLMKECEECPDYQSCRPVPMVLTRMAAG